MRQIVGNLNGTDTLTEDTPQTTIPHSKTMPHYIRTSANPISLNLNQLYHSNSHHDK